MGMCASRRDYCKRWRKRRKANKVFTKVDGGGRLPTECDAVFGGGGGNPALKSSCGPSQLLRQMQRRAVEASRSFYWFKVLGKQDTKNVSWLQYVSLHSVFSFVLRHRSHRCICTAKNLQPPSSRRPNLLTHCCWPQWDSEPPRNN